MKRLRQILNIKIIFIIAVSLSLGVVLEYYLNQNSKTSSTQIQRITIKNSNYKFIDPLLAYDNVDEINNNYQ